MGEGLVTTPEALLQVRCGGLISMIEEVGKQPRGQSISSPKACTVPLALGREGALEALTFSLQDRPRPHLHVQESSRRSHGRR